MFSGDPLDRTLRHVEIEVLIPKKMREKAKDEKCAEEVKGNIQKCAYSNMSIT
jgi:COX assembly protein 1